VPLLGREETVFVKTQTAAIPNSTDLLYEVDIQFRVKKKTYDPKRNRCLKGSNSNGKAVPSQAWSGPEVSKKLRFPDFMTTTLDDGKVVSPTHRPPLPQEMLLVLISVRG
jgi:hypothetical protein